MPTQDAFVTALRNAIHEYMETEPDMRYAHEALSIVRSEVNDSLRWLATLQSVPTTQPPAVLGHFVGMGQEPTPPPPVRSGYDLNTCRGSEAGCYG